MTTWLELEKRFLELEQPLRSSRLDRQDGAAGEYWRVAASFDSLATSRFESISKLAGKKLLDSIGLEQLPEELRDAPSDLFRWYRAISNNLCFYKPGPVAYQTDERGNNTGWITTGHIANPAGVSAAFCLELISMESETPESSSPLTINVSGPNARLNIGSTDNSTNSYSATTASLFQDMRVAVERNVPKEDLKALLDGIEGLEQSAGGPTFGARYKEFIQVAANHISVIAPFLPALSALLPT